VKYHDYYLKGYSVSDFGKTITLDLVYDYPNHPKDESVIEFIEVAAYQFSHTGGAIITDITETPLSKLLEQAGNDLIEWSKGYGNLLPFHADLAACKVEMEKQGFKTWTIWSAIGFSGFIIAKGVSQKG